MWGEHGNKVISVEHKLRMCSVKGIYNFHMQKCAQNTSWEVCVYLQ